MKKTFFIVIISVLFSANVFAGNYNKLTFDTYVFIKMHENKRERYLQVFTALSL